MFLKNEEDIGNKTPGIQTIVYFEYENMIITGLSSSCTCSAPLDDRGNSRVITKHTATAFPIHLRAQGFAPFHANVTVDYYTPEDPIIRQVVLTIKGTLFP